MREESDRTVGEAGHRTKKKSSGSPNTKDPEDCTQFLHPRRIPHPTGGLWSCVPVRSSDFWITRLPASSHSPVANSDIMREPSPVTAAGP